MNSEKTAEKKREYRPSKRYSGVVFRGKSWSYIVHVPGEQGSPRKKWVSGFPTEHAAHKARCEAVAEIEAKQYITPSPKTVEQFLQEWLTLREPHLRPASANVYRVAIEKHLSPRLGGIVLQNLSPLHIQQAVTECQAIPLSASTVNQYFTVLASALHQACRWRLIREHPMTAGAVLLPQPEERKPPSYTTEEVLRLAEAARTHQHGTAFLLALFAGLRRGEIIGLRWQDVDLREDVLYVRGQRRKAYGKERENGMPWTYAPPKSRGTEDEEIPLLPELREALMRLQERQWAWAADPLMGFRPQGWVIARANGDPLSPPGVDDAFRRLALKLELPLCNLHACRHALCVHLLRSGVPVQTVSRIMRHRDPAFTLRVYGHEIPGERQEAVRTLHRALEGARRMQENDREAAEVCTNGCTAA